MWEPDRRRYAQINVDGTRNVLEAAVRVGAAKVVHISSMVVFRQPAGLPITEDSPIGPPYRSEYARTKYAGDCIAWEMHRTKGLPLVIVYPSGVIGPGDPKSTGKYVQDLLQGLPARILERHLMALVHVRDVAEAIVRAAENEQNAGEKYLVGKESLRWSELNRQIAEIAGITLPKPSLPDGLVLAIAALRTAAARITKRPPAQGLSWDMARTISLDWWVDGSKAERELGLTYTPIRVALEEEVASCRGSLIKGPPAAAPVG